MAKQLLTEHRSIRPLAARLDESAKADRRSALAEARTEAENVEAHGLDPKLFLAVIEADLGVLGVVNANGRIYPTRRGVIENVKLDARARSGKPDDTVWGEAGHPDGQPTHNVACRWVEVWCETSGERVACEKVEGGWMLPDSLTDADVVTVRGKLAFLDTTVGRDLWIQYLAEKPLGTSSRSWGIAVQHTLDEESPYLAANQQHAGAVVDVIEEQELITYDIVTIPSAGTYVDPARVAESVEQEAAPRAPEEKPMKLEDLKKDHPELVKAIADEAASAALDARPLAKRVAELDEAKAKQVERLIAVVVENQDDGDDGLMSKLGALVEDKMAPVRERVTMLEEAKRVAEAEAKKAKQEAEASKAELAAVKTVEAVKVAAAEAIKSCHEKIQPFVRQWIEADIAAGAIKDAEAVAPLAKRLAESFEAVSKATVETGSAPVPDATEKTESTDSAEKANTHQDQLIEAVLGSNGLEGLRGLLGR